MANCFPKLRSFLSSCISGYVSIRKRCGAMDVEVRPGVLGSHTTHVPMGQLPTSSGKVPGASAWGAQLTFVFRFSLTPGVQPSCSNTALQCERKHSKWRAMGRFAPSSKNRKAGTAARTRYPLLLSLPIAAWKGIQKTSLLTNFCYLTTTEAVSV